MKLFSAKFKLTLLFLVTFMFLFSSTAFAYNYYPTTKYYSQYQYYTPKTTYYNNYQSYNYQPYTYKYTTPQYSWNWNNYYKKTPTVPSEPATPAQPTTPTKPPVEKPSTPTPSTGLSADEQKMVDLVNKERTSQGLQPLKVDSQLVKLARMKSQDMIDNNYFSHTSPTYGSPFEMMKDYGVSYRYAGENLAGASDVTKAHNNLMNSDGHRKNILSSDFTHIGIGIVNGGPYGKMYTQLFIGK